MSERFKVTKSEEAVLFRNYGATADDDADNEAFGKNEPHVVIGSNHLTTNKDEEEERDTGRNH